MEVLNRLPLACNTPANVTENWNFSDWLGGRRPIDFGTCVFECLSYEVFWVLGVLIIIKACVSRHQLYWFKESKRGNGNMTCWLQRRLTSRALTAVAMNIVFLMLVVVVLEGLAVLLTAWRLTIFFIQLTFPAWEPRGLAFLTYLPISIIILLAWAGICWGGYKLVAVQVGLIKELCRLYLDGPKKTVSADVELGQINTSCPPAYEGWETAELRG
ncbi:hypothetical protein ACHAPT_008623 [Fusarium lateritium]